MILAEEQIYEQLRDWLKKTWNALPETDELLPLIKATYTPEEAAIAIDMPFSGRNLEDLAEMKQTSPEDLRQRLDEMAVKGLVFRTAKGDTVRYSLNDAFFVGYRGTFWPGRTDERSKSIAPLANQYYYHGMWDMFVHTSHKGLRTLPIHGTIKDTREILPYEEVIKVLDQHEYFTVSVCPCRHRKNLDPDYPDSQYPMETCLHFGRLGRYIVENDMGREITRRETEEILRKSAEAGLVHGVSNMQEAPDTLCNCDPHACLMFEAFHKLKHAQGMTPSNYRVRINSETCIGCGLCVKRCPMEALNLEDCPEAKDRVTVVEAEGKEEKKTLKNKSGKISAVNPDFCIGCGVCAYKCPSKSLTLEKAAIINHPPKDMREYMKLFMADLAEAQSKTGDKRSE
jgi:NAD-dependent dihydropyrimidine dehydrogenase PreA subunit